MVSINEIIRAFRLPGHLSDTVDEYGSGHINNTSLISMTEDGVIHKYIIQMINKNVFQYPEKVMENSVQVTEHLYRVIAEDGGDPDRETIHYRKTADDVYYTVDDDGQFWRAYDYIDDTLTLDVARDIQDMYASGHTFAVFNKRLMNFPVAELHETIPNFHDTPKRLARFRQVVEQDPLDRLKNCREEVEFILSREEECYYLTNLMSQGVLPLRVTHNDTKLNNVLFDLRTNAGICVIDLDTVMPGLMAYDFGDAIRSGATTAEEDERDLSKVEFSLELFEAFTQGFLEILAPYLGMAEKESLVWGAKLMTLEVGMRFLTDYLEGDVYFKIHKSRPHHNLERSRTQLKLVAEMEKVWDDMIRIVRDFN